MELEEIKTRVREVVASSDVSEARAIANELSAGGAAVDGVDESSALLRQLLFLRLPQLDPEQAAWLMQHYVLDAFAMSDFDFARRVEDTIELIWDMDKRSDVLHHFLTAVETCEQLLGDQPVVIDGVELTPSVENWIKDYLFWPTENKFRQSIDAVNYASKALNPQKLSAEYRALLIRVLGWRDQISNTLYDYQNAEELDLEEYPNLDPRLLAASVDDFESPEVARAVLDKALAVKRPNPLSGIPSSTTSQSPMFSSKLIASASGLRPNIQGVLSNAPIKKDVVLSKQVTSLESEQNVARTMGEGLTPEKVTSQPARPPVVLRPAPVAGQKAEVGSTSKKKLAEQGLHTVAPAKVPDNLPMVETEALPAVIQSKRARTPVPKSVAVSQKFPQPVGNVSPTLNREQPQAEVVRKKNDVNSDIEQRLASLKKRATLKN